MVMQCNRKVLTFFLSFTNKQIGCFFTSFFLFSNNHNVMHIAATFTYFQVHCMYVMDKSPVDWTIGVGPSILSLKQSKVVGAERKDKLSPE
jgi:hypothetical protein